MTAPTGRRRWKRISTKAITVPGNLRLACDEFNSGRFFECHETLEEIWQEERGGVRDLYKGLIQVAAAFVHVSRGNHKGAKRLLRTALGYLGPYRESGAMGFELADFCARVEEVLDFLDKTGTAPTDMPPARVVPSLHWNESQVMAEAVRWRAWGFDQDGNALWMEITTVE